MMQEHVIRIDKNGNPMNDWTSNLIDWITFYRRNIHRFIQHYFQVKLHLYQVIWIYFMSICESFITIASRASAKSWLIALFALARATLYPASEVVVVATTQKQAAIIFGKIDQLRTDYPNIAREIKTYTDSQNKCLCVLHNGSTIKVVACNEGGRGNRSTFTIGEEFRLMDKEKFDSIVKPFAYARQTPYLKNPKYMHLIEEPREILISSAYHKSEWWYKETLTNIKMMLEGKNVGFIAFDYLIAIHHGIKTKKLIDKERQTMDEITFMEEYENLPFGENSDAYFRLEMFEKNKRIEKVFYPLRDDLLDKKKNPFFIERQDGEIRIISVDIATRKGKSNDNTIISCIRAIPTSKGYHRECVYMESHQGEHTGKQALRIKQVYFDFKGDYIVLDIQNAGIAIFEQLAVLTKDNTRGIEYDPLTVYEHKSLDKKTIEELREKTLSTKAKPVIYPISATPKLNSDIAVDFRDVLQRKMISFPVDENEAEDYLLRTNKEFANTIDIGLKSWYLYPYRQFSELKNESINLQYSMVSGNVQIKAVGLARKDRYTSVSYGNYFISLLEQDLLKENIDSDMSAYIVGGQLSIKNNKESGINLQNTFRLRNQFNKFFKR